MTRDVPVSDELAYHLLLEPQEAAIVRQALNLLIADEAHEPAIRSLARQVLAHIDEGTATAGSQTASPGALTLPLTAPQMKITHTAAKLLLDDTQREQQRERQLLWSVLEKLPDEHSLRAITLA